ncbi:hypothetical protein [Methylomonas sp. AM2-LC]|uniref:hypothetical protein n=1 Tax=Methylomonas sp. AM2-LC TaxID=3153301 RepID=UPI003266C973
MERNYHKPTSVSIDLVELNWRTAFHEAGHAVSIQIGNQEKQLPPVFFEILVKRATSPDGQFFAKVLNGNLIQNFPIDIVESFSQISGSDQHSCQRAYEADVINLLVGPLAEAKYISIRDNQMFNSSLLTAKALYNYGGYTDMKKIETYLDAFIAAKELREDKMLELLVQAFQFISNPKNWGRITKLAHYILNSSQETISCDEAITIMDGGSPEQV